MKHNTIHDRADRIAKLMETQMGVRGKGLEAKIAKAGRRLPRHLRREGAALTAALKLEENPKLSRQIDRAQIDRAERLFTEYLTTLDPFRRRLNRAIDLLATNAFTILVTAVMVIVVLVWRGFL